MYPLFFKRGLDLLIAITAFILLAPIFFVIGLWLSIANRGTPFFVQTRPGRDAKLFKIIKFKTMNDRRDGRGNLLPDHQRITSVGAFVRKTSLDEIPQLLNVIKGDMSLIGPRPLLPEYLPLYTSLQNRRHEIRPGITGWAQVNGRNAISWNEKFLLDVYYVDNLSLKMDIRIFYLTFVKVFKSEGVNTSATTTMEPFTGHN